MIAIHSKRVVLPAGIREAIVVTSNGHIISVQEHWPENENCQRIELGNQVLMPGLIDPHVHINEPGRTEWEGFDTATRAAIASGITTLVEMPLNASPVTTSVEALQLKRKATEYKLHCHLGLWGGIIPGNTHEIEPLIKAGVRGFKAFLTHSGIDEFPNVTEEDLHQAMPIIAAHGLPLLVHCELTDEVKRATGDPRSYANYLASRPQQWETDAIALMIRLCEQYNCHVHIVHLSAADALPMIREARAKGLPLTVETGQHYLYFNAEAIGDGQTQFKCAPPIREKSNNELLWDALKDGSIDFVATDHSPATPELKEMQSGNFMKAWGGIASLQFAMPVLWTAAAERGFSLEHIVQWLSTAPASLAGLSHSHGKIAEGYVADLCVFDDQEVFTVTEFMILHRHKVTPYLDEQLKGVVKRVFLSGEEVFNNGLLIKTSRGKLL